MKICNPNIDQVFDTKIKAVNTVVIENKKLMYDLIYDIYSQIDGQKGESVLSNDDKIMDFSKYAELITSFIPFEINQKSLLSKIATAIEKEAISPENYESTMELLSSIEKFLDDLTSDFDCNLSYSKITASSIVKSVGIQIQDDYSDLCEKIIDYMELVRQFDTDKLFVFVNMRGFVDDVKMIDFFKTVIDHEFNVILFENTQYDMLQYEKRVTVDGDLCVF